MEHVYAHSQGASQGILQNQATEAGEHGQENEKGEGHYSFPDSSEKSIGDEDEDNLDWDLVDGLDGGCDLESFKSIDSDVNDDILDYQNS